MPKLASGIPAAALQEVSAVLKIPEVEVHVEAVLQETSKAPVSSRTQTLARRCMTPAHQFRAQMQHQRTTNTNHAHLDVVEGALTDNLRKEGAGCRISRLPSASPPTVASLLLALPPAVQPPCCSDHANLVAAAKPTPQRQSFARVVTDWAACRESAALRMAASPNSIRGTEGLWGAGKDGGHTLLHTDRLRLSGETPIMLTQQTGLADNPGRPTPHKHAQLTVPVEFGRLGAGFVANSLVAERCSVQGFVPLCRTFMRIAISRGYDEFQSTPPRTAFWFCRAAFACTVALIWGTLILQHVCLPCGGSSPDLPG